MMSEMCSSVRPGSPFVAAVDSESFELVATPNARKLCQHQYVVFQI